MRRSIAGGGARRYGRDAGDQPGGWHQQLAAGSLRYHKPFSEGGILVPQSESLATETALEYYFSDVVAFWPAPPGGFAGPRQPFASSARVDRLGLMIRPRNLTAVLTLESWNNHRFTVSLERKGDLLVGIGTPAGGGADSAVYLLSLFGPDTSA